MACSTTLKSALRAGLLLVALPNCGRVWGQLVEWAVAQGGNGHFYEVVSAPAGINWANANLGAVNRGGYLATITSAAENAFVFGMAEADASVWYSGYGPYLGGIQPAGSVEPAGGWTWITGEAFSYRNWSSAQPNNNNAEDRIQFGGAANRSSTWNDIGQNNIMFTRGYVVEYDRHPNAVSLTIARKDVDQVQLSWASRLNVTYSIEWTDELGGEWTLLSTVAGTGGTLTVDDFLAEGRRFYRSVVAQ